MRGDAAPLVRSWMLLRRPYGAGEPAGDADADLSRCDDVCDTSEARADATAPPADAVLACRCTAGACATELRAGCREPAGCGAGCIDDVRAGDSEEVRDAGAGGAVGAGVLFWKDELRAVAVGAASKACAGPCAA